MLILLFTFGLLSITLFEALIIVLILYTAVKVTNKKLKLTGSLLLPLSLHALVVLLSTLVYHTSQLGKAVERGVFLLAYPFGNFIRLNGRALLRFNQFLVLTGLFFLPVVFYNYKKTGQPALLWGGWFEVGAFYTLFAIASLSLFFYKKKLLYLIPLLLFVGTVFFTMRRSAMLGLAFALISFAILSAKSLSKKAFFGVIFLVFAGFSLSSIVLIQKDIRYRTLYEVLTFQRSLDDEAMNTISSARWQIAKAGIEVIRRDIEEGRWLPLLIGHGVNSGLYLEPKSPVGGIYESVLPLSELIEKGLLGLLSVLWVYFNYIRLLVSFRVREKEDYLIMPLLLALGAHLTGAIFTFFWDALLPLYLILFNVFERFRNIPHPIAFNPKIGK